MNKLEEFKQQCHEWDTLLNDEQRAYWLNRCNSFNEALEAWLAARKSRKIGFYGTKVSTV